MTSSFEQFFHNESQDFTYAPRAAPVASLSDLRTVFELTKTCNTANAPLGLQATFQYPERSKYVFDSKSEKCGCKTPSEKETPTVAT